MSIKFWVQIPYIHFIHTGVYLYIAQRAVIAESRVNESWGRMRGVVMVWGSEAFNGFYFPI